MGFSIILALFLELMVVHPDIGHAGVGEATTAARQSSPARGPLKVHPSNSRYFTDGSGKAIYLTGSHTWNNLQDRTDPNAPETRPFDYTAYLEFLENHNHNFIRIWMWEQSAWAPWTTEKTSVDPLPYRRTGPGTALDGGP